MRVAIDAVGRMVVPRSLRDELGISGPAELEIAATDGVLEVSVPDVAVRVEDHEGLSVLVTDAPVEPMTADDVRAAVERTRR